MENVSPQSYESASELAAQGGTPVAIALAAAGPFGGRTQHIIQVNDGGEAPAGSRVTIIRGGLLDDAVRGERWETSLDRSETGGWKICGVKKAWRCWRGGNTGTFGTQPCP